MFLASILPCLILLAKLCLQHTAFVSALPVRPRVPLVREAQNQDSNALPPRILVVGAAGKVGQRVVKRLSDSGAGVVALCRDVADARAVALGKLPGVTVASCDLMDVRGLINLAAGCSAVIDVHGKTRFTKLEDFLPPWKFVSDKPPDDPTHPYYVNGVGVENLVRAAKTAGCQKFVLLTGLSLFFSPYDPVSILFNLLLSLSSRYKWVSENAVRRSGLDYTILRPGELSEENTRPSGTGIRLARGPLTAANKLPRADVADLCITALTHPSAAFSTLACQSAAGEDAYPDATSALEALGQGPEHESIIDVMTEDEPPDYASVSFIAALGLFSVALVLALFGLKQGLLLVR